MAAATYVSPVIVLRKTKLGETDLILTLLAKDGSQLRAVAKGARKPSNSFAARLELFSVAEVMCAQGRNLDIVKEARLVASNQKLRTSLEHAACAAPMVELLDKLTQKGLEGPQLYPLTVRALEALNAGEGQQAPLICAAHLLKTLGFAGFKPSLKHCVSCGSVLDLQNSQQVAFSYVEGGVVCAACSADFDTTFLASSTLGWAEALLGSTFSQINGLHGDQIITFAILNFCYHWISVHVGVRLKSLNFLFTSGLF